MAFSSLDATYTEKVEYCASPRASFRSVDRSLEDPLLTNQTTEHDDEAGQGHFAYYDAIKKVLGLGFWVILATVFHPLYMVTSSIATGRMGTDQLAGFGLGSLTTGICAISIALAFNGGMMTFCTQSAGANDFRQVIVYRNRAIFLNTVLFVVLGFPMVWIEQIYLYIGQDPGVAFYAATYVQIVFPSVYFYFIFQVLAFYCTALKLYEIPVVSIALASFVHLFLTYVLCVKYDWGFEGVCWATFWHFFTRLFCNVVMMMCSSRLPEVTDVRLFSIETINNLGSLFYICLTACAMTVWTSWAFDILTLMASYLGPELTAAQTIMRTVNMLSFTIPIGFQIVCALLVGTSVGEGRQDFAISYYKISVTVSLLCGIFTIIFLIMYKEWIISLYTTDQLIIDSLEYCWPVFLAYLFFTSIQFVCAGVVQGIGNQGFGALTTLIAYWGIGIPVASLLVYKLNYGLGGLWTGPLLSSLFLTITYLGYISTTDWNEVIQRGVERKNQEEEARRLRDKARIHQQSQRDYEYTMHETDSENSVRVN